MSALRVELKNPCPVSWDDMRGDDRRRFCESCGKHVHNLSAYTYAQAAKLLAAAERPCVRSCDRDDGTLVTADAPDAPTKRVVHLRMLATVATTMSLSACAAPEGSLSASAVRGGEIMAATYVVEEIRLQPAPPEEAPKPVARRHWPTRPLGF